jgi:dihydrolipoamide dehydrogenase
MKYDVVFIGSGPAGYFGAIRAAQLGLKTACVEKHSRVGGTCLNVGCIPSKTLLSTTEHFEWIKKDAQLQGIMCKDVAFDFPAMMKRKEEVVTGLTNGVASLFKKNQIASIKGTAQFISPNTIQVGSETIESANFVIATGSESSQIPFLPFDEKKVLSSTGALALASVPKKMLVIGAGVIGVELASVYNRLGTEIVVIEMLDKVAPMMDAAISRTLQQILKKQGFIFHLSAKVTKADVKDQVSLQVEMDNQVQTISGDCVLVAVGRRPYTKELGLDKISIAVDKHGFIPVDNRFRTSVPNVYAVGDVIEGPMLAHKAFREGMVVAEIIAGQNPQINYLSVPNVIYTNPEVAAVGLTEQEAKELNLDVKVGTSHFRGNSRARCIGVSDGFVKVIGDKATDRLLGVHIIGPSASEMIGEAALAMELHTTVTKIAETPHAHPTLSEAIKEACLGALGRAIES